MICKCLFLCKKHPKFPSLDNKVLSYLIKFVPKGFPIGFEMAEKNVNRQPDKRTNRQTFYYINK